VSRAASRGGLALLRGDLALLRGVLALLRGVDFPKLFGAHLVSWFGMSMAPIAIAFGVLDLTGSARDTGLIVASQTGAQVLVLLLGGVISDRLPRRRVMIGADLAAMTVQATIALCFALDLATVPRLMGLMALNGAALAFHSPALTGIIPEVVPTLRLQSANALLGTARSAAVSLGAAAGGVLVASAGAGATVFVNALTFAASAAFVSRLHVRPALPRARATILQDVRGGFAEFVSHRWLWVIVLQFSLVVAGTQSFYGLLGPAVSRATLGGAVDWGFIASAFGIGTLCGGLLALRISVHRPMLVATLCVLVFAVPPLTLAASTIAWPVAVATFAHGVAGQIFGVLWVTTLQRKIPGEMLSRVSAYDNLGSIALAPLGLVGAGLLLERSGATVSLTVAAALIVVPTLFALLDRDVRTMRLD
jgi:predicted MFS family arabinose efflux permease